MGRLAAGGAPKSSYVINISRSTLWPILPPRSMTQFAAIHQHFMAHLRGVEQVVQRARALVGGRGRLDLRSAAFCSINNRRRPVIPAGPGTAERPWAWARLGAFRGSSQRPIIR
jgi:hypothetical protein